MIEVPIIAKKEREPVIFVQKQAKTGCFVANIAGFYAKIIPRCPIASKNTGKTLDAFPKTPFCAQKERESAWKRAKIPRKLAKMGKNTEKMAFFVRFCAKIVSGEIIAQLPSVGETQRRFLRRKSGNPTAPSGRPIGGNPLGSAPKLKCLLGLFLCKSAEA